MKSEDQQIPRSSTKESTTSSVIRADGKEGQKGTTIPTFPHSRSHSVITERERPATSGGSGSGFSRGFPSQSSFAAASAAFNTKSFGPLNAATGKEAAAHLKSLVNTALPSIAKTLGLKKGKEESSPLEPEDDAPSAPPHSDDRTAGRAVGIPGGGRKVEERVEGAVVGSPGTAPAPVSLGPEDKAPEVVIGVLSKWINIGRGWGPRLFILEGGVLSYYKLDGSNKVSVQWEVKKRRNPTLIGDEVQRLLRREREKEKWTEGGPKAKALGEIHLLVSTFRESESDDKKFYVFSGTKTLDIRAETREERTQWVEILEAAKLRVDANMKELDELEEAKAAAGVASARDQALGQIRERLLAAGVGKEVVDECEEIVRRDVVAQLQQRVQEEQIKRRQLEKRVKVLEADKADLESTVVEETRHSAGMGLRSGILEPQEEEDDNEDEYRSLYNEPIPEALLAQVADHDEDDDVDSGGDASDMFHESLSDFVESGRFDFASSPAVSATSVDMEKVGFDYPVVQRRQSLPDPAEKEKPVGLWNIIKDCVGKDLSRITLPVFFNEPISTLQKAAEELEYSWLLDRAAEYGRRGDELMRTAHVAAFALSAYAGTVDRVQKPFNPLIGETYEAEYPDKGIRLIAEKVVHQPPIVACHCQGRGWTFWGDSNIKIRFWGPSMQLDPLGVLSVRFDDGELFEWSKVSTGIYNIILGKLYIDHFGTMRINSNRGMSVRLKFKERSMFGGAVHQVQGTIQNGAGKTLATLMGKWDESLHIIVNEDSRDGSSSQRSTFDEKDFQKRAQLLWQAAKPVPMACKYRFTPFTVTLNEITPGLEEKLPPTDSRLRPDQRLLENGYYDRANEEKLRLENRQRKARKEGEPGWHPRWFKPGGPHNTWMYNGGYWESRNKAAWDGVKEIFGPDPEVSTEVSK